MQSALERREAILSRLSALRRTTVPELAQEFGVSTKTVRRDIELLSCTYPILSVPGANGGIRVMDGWYLHCHYLSPDQEALLRRLSSGLQPEDAATMQRILTQFSKPTV